MKKIFAVLMAMVMIFSLSACEKELSSQNENNNNDNTSNSDIETSADNKNPKFVLVKVHVGGVVPDIISDRSVADLSGNHTNWAIGNEWVLTYDNDGNRITRTYTNDNGNSGKHEWTYDSSGNVLSEISTSNGELLHKAIYTYHKNNKKASETIEYTKTYDGGTYNVEYDTHGNKLLEEMKNTSEYYAYCDKYSYKYDDTGKKLSMEFVKTKSGETSQGFSKWNYDNKGLVKTEEIGNEKGTYLIVEYKYDEKGNLVSKIETNTTTNTVNEIFVSKNTNDANATYTYRANGNIATKSLEKSGKIYLWKCDEYGNVIEYNMDYKDKPNSTYKVTFEYEKL